jgi:hypothetical protein
MRNSESPGQNLNQGHYKCKAGVLTTSPQGVEGSAISIQLYYGPLNTQQEFEG